MSLVAYESSDEASEDEVMSVTIVKPSKLENEIPKKLLTEQVNLENSIKSNFVTEANEKMEEEENDDVKDEDVVGGCVLSFGALPKPKNFGNACSLVTEEDDIPEVKKLTVVDATTKRDKGPARISVPSLSEFKDVDEELERSKLKPTASKQGTGLFAILPPPKNELTKKSNNLIPHVLTKSAPVKNSKKSLTKVPASKCTKVEEKVHCGLPMIDYESNSDDDDEDVDKVEHVDFFSLSKASTKPQLTTQLCPNFPTICQTKSYELPQKPENVETSKRTDNSRLMENEEKDDKTLTSTVMNLPRDEILLKNKAAVGPKLPIPEQEFNVDDEGNVAFDEKAIEYLCGKRGVKRKKKMIEEANIIEINGEDIKPDEREWLVKAMTEEPVQRPVSMQGPGGPSSQSKKKHQITYLAHQAKAMEVELKNTWSQNRMVRKQTQSKYGF